MALPTLTKTWEFKVNQAITATGTALATNRTILKAIKDSLISSSDYVNGANVSTTPANMFTVRYSCDGTTAGSAGDGVDRWSDISKLNWANAGSAHSWMVLRQAAIGSNYEILISCEASAGNGQSLLIAVSPSAGFTGGTTLLRPTATDESVIINGTIWGGVVNTDANVKLHVFKSSDGECWRVFVANGGQINTSWIMEKSKSSNTSWANRGIALALGAGAATNTLSNNNLYSLANFYGRGASAMTMYLATMSCGPGLLNVLETNPDDLSSDWDFFGQQLFTITAGNKWCRGELNDVWYGSTTIASGDSFPLSVSPNSQFVQFGSLVFPWCQTSALMS